MGRECSVYYFLQRMGLFLHIFYYPHTRPAVKIPAHANRVCISAPFGIRHASVFRSPAVAGGCNGDAQRVPLPRGVYYTRTSYSYGKAGLWLMVSAG